MPSVCAGSVSCGRVFHATLSLSVSLQATVTVTGDSVSLTVAKQRVNPSSNSEHCTVRSPVRFCLDSRSPTPSYSLRVQSLTPTPAFTLYLPSPSFVRPEPQRGLPEASRACALSSLAPSWCVSCLLYSFPHLFPARSVLRRGLHRAAADEGCGCAHPWFHHAENIPVLPQHHRLQCEPSNQSGLCMHLGR